MKGIVKMIRENYDNNVQLLPKALAQEITTVLHTIIGLAGTENIWIDIQHEDIADHIHKFEAKPAPIIQENAGMILDEPERSYDDHLLWKQYWEYPTQGHNQRRRRNKESNPSSDGIHAHEGIRKVGMMNPAKNQKNKNLNQNSKKATVNKSKGKHQDVPTVCNKISNAIDNVSTQELKSLFTYNISDDTRSTIDVSYNNKNARISKVSE